MNEGAREVKRFASGGCDGIVRMWTWKYVPLPQRSDSVLMGAGTKQRRGRRTPCSLRSRATPTGFEMSLGLLQSASGELTSPRPDRSVAPIYATRTNSRTGQDCIHLDSGFSFCPLVQGRAGAQGVPWCRSGGREVLRRRLARELECER